MKVSQKEIESVLKLEPFQRYKYFMKRVADWEVMYSIKKDDEWALAEVEDEGEVFKLFSLWNAEEFAELNAIGEWEGYDVAEISLDSFEEVIIPIIESSNYLINVFSVREETGFVVDLNEFLRDLQNELDRFKM